MEFFPIGCFGWDKNAASRWRVHDLARQVATDIYGVVHSLGWDT